MGPELFVVTGGGTGLGRDLALRLTRCGHAVVIVGRRAEPLTDTAAAGSGLVEPVAADLSTVAGTESLLTVIGNRPLAGIVTAAGGIKRYSNDNRPESVRTAWTEMLNTNFYSALLPVEALIPNLIDDRGRVVLISSTSAIDGLGGPYASAKAILTGYGMDLARRLGPRGITANVVAPGFVPDTPIHAASGVVDIEPIIQEMTKLTLVGRVGKPKDIAHIVLSLLHEDAGWTTGQLISPNGGTNLVHLPSSRPIQYA
jgi:3-oxoacyl-[acyl-carrier protein] reductase